MPNDYKALAANARLARVHRNNSIHLVTWLTDGISRGRQAALLHLETQRVRVHTTYLLKMLARYLYQRKNP